MSSYPSITRRELLIKLTLGTAVAGNLGLYSTLGYSQNISSSANKKHDTTSVRGISSQHDLLVSLILSSAVPHGSAVFSNRTGNPIVLSGFDPGNIVFDHHYVDLTHATGISYNNPLILKSGETRSFQIETHSLYSSKHTPDSNTYVWVDDAVEQLSQDAKLIEMAGLLDVNRAVLFAAPAQSDNNLFIS